MPNPDILTGRRRSIVRPTNAKPRHSHRTEKKLSARCFNRRKKRISKKYPPPYFPKMGDSNFQYRSLKEACNMGTLLYGEYFEDKRKKGKVYDTRLIQ
jgi:hypothetical protein